jgi:hypothetical protein
MNASADDGLGRWLTSGTMFGRTGPRQEEDSNATGDLREVAERLKDTRLEARPSLLQTRHIDSVYNSTPSGRHRIGAAAKDFRSFAGKEDAAKAALVTPVPAPGAPTTSRTARAAAAAAAAAAASATSKTSASSTAAPRRP